MFTVIDLFCGCGGMSWGLQKAGFHILAGVDNCAHVLQTFRLNHPTAQALEQDLTQLEPEALRQQLQINQGELSCLVGGPPCQGFSKNVPAAYRFLDDPRNQLFRYFMKFVAAFLPATVVMENVAELYNAYGGVVRTEICEQFASLGYEVEVKVLFAPDYGIPQRRKRCFFFASRTGISPQFPQPEFSLKPDLLNDAYRSAWDAISDLPALANGEGYEPMAYTLPPQNEYQRQMRQTSAMIHDHITRKLNDRQYSRILSLEPGQGIKELPDELRPKSGYSGAYGRLDFEKVAPTITRWVFHPGSGRFCHPRDVRLITIREAARLQSFSDDFHFSGTYIQKAHQVGNAVPPMFMQVLAPAIQACLAYQPADQQPEPEAIAGD